jgi:hypothetical protein
MIFSSIDSFPQADFDKMAFSEDESDHEQKKPMFVREDKTIIYPFYFFYCRIIVLMKICINHFVKMLAKLNHKVIYNR